jgi:CRP-like cAMP-binding protein
MRIWLFDNNLYQAVDPFMTTSTNQTQKDNDEKIKRFAKVLHSVLFFNTFSIEELYAIGSEERFFKWKILQKDSLLFSQGTFDQHFYIIFQGKIDIIGSDKTSKEICLDTFQKGDFFGELAVTAPGEPRRATARVSSEGEAILCEIDCTLIETAPAPLKTKFLKKFLDLILERLQPIERDLSFHQEIIRYATETHLAQPDEFFQYTIETAVNDNNRLTQYIKYTDFLLNRKIPAQQSNDLLQALITKADKKLPKSNNTV